MENAKVKIFTGNANPSLAREVANYLGLELGSAFVGKSPFDDARANAVFWHNKTKTKAINAEKTKCRDRL